MCDQFVPYREGDDLNLVIDNHINAGCIIENSQSNNKCSFGGCQDFSSMKIICEKCNKKFCVSHRLDMNHKCTIINQNQIKSNSNNNNLAKQIENIRLKFDFLFCQIKKKKRNKFKIKDQNKFRKMNLMKMKMKAHGKDSISFENRFYLEIIFPLELNKQSKYFFFNKGL